MRNIKKNKNKKEEKTKWICHVSERNKTNCAAMPCLAKNKAQFSCKKSNNK